MKTIASFSTAVEAHLLRMRLEAAGIPAFLQDENLVQMDWVLSNAIGGVRVQIADRDAEVAREFLAAESPPPSPDAVDVVCPGCGSHQTAPDEWPRRLAFLCLLIFRFPLFIGRHRWRCAACHQVFNVPPASSR